MCQDCDRSLPEAPSTLCFTRDNVYVCVCVCVFAIACSTHHPLRPPDVHSPLIYLVGGPSLHVSRLRLILARGYVHPVYHEEHCVCICHGLLPLPPLCPEWSGMQWSGVEWSGVEWNAVEWSAEEWSGVEWGGVGWGGVEWSGVR